MSDEIFFNFLDPRNYYFSNNMVYILTPQVSLSLKESSLYIFHYIFGNLFFISYPGIFFFFGDYYSSMYFPKY